MQYGLDCLGLARFGKDALDAFPSGYALGVFSKTFGDSMPAVRQLASRCPAVRVQLMWSDSHTFSDHDIPVMKAEAQRWDQFAKEHKGMKVYLSPFCEHNLSNPDRYLQIVKDLAPHCEPVNSVWKGSRSAKFTNEVHGSHSQPAGGNYIFSYDGSDISESDVDGLKAKHKNAKIWFGWTANFNGNTEADTTVKVPREQRKAWPTAKLIRSVRYVMQKSKGITKLPPNWLWKSHAEDKGAGDIRANKPCLIAPVKASSAALLMNGRAIATAPYYGAFIDGRSRYYFGDWGFEIAEKTGGMPLELSVGGKVYGRVNPAFRDGSFR